MGNKDALAVDYMLRRIREDGKLAYLLLYTQAWELLTEAAAERAGYSPEDLPEYRRQFANGLRTTRIIEAEEAA